MDFSTLNGVEGVILMDRGPKGHLASYLCGRFCQLMDSALAKLVCLFVNSLKMQTGH